MTIQGRHLASARDVVRADLHGLCATLAADLERLAGRHVLITGAAGFLGYYLVQTLLEWNGQRPGERIGLTACDNFARGVPDWLGRVADVPGCRLLVHDVTTPLPVELDSLDFVIHAASIASPTYYRQHPLDTIDANVNGLRHLLDRCRRQAEDGQPVSGFLFFSSSEIYGDPDPAHIPTSEEYRGYVSCTGPRACYDESKRFGETLSVTFARQFGLPVRIARPFNNYGPGLRLGDGRVVPDLARDILAGRDLVLLSDGSPRRTFCYVADAIQGYYRILVRGRDGEAYNIGTEAPEISIRELAGQMVAIGRELFGYGGTIVHRTSEDADYLADNPQRRCPSIGKARSQLGFEPSVSLPDGLRRTLLWYRGQFEGAAS